MNDHDSSSIPSIDELTQGVAGLRAALGRVIVGQEEVLEQLLAALLTGGHVLLEGVPGVAKTLMARTLAAGLGLAFKRVQFTPDLMPADIVGTNVFDFQQGQFHLQKGPIFTQVLLADEINRTPPKTQAALLEAMEEHQVTIDGETHLLVEPFFVVATQNPLEHEGTYPLPEAQLDRFLMKVRVGYPAEDEELEVYRRFSAGELQLAVRPEGIEKVLGAEQLEGFRRALGEIHVEDKVLGYVRQVVLATRQSVQLGLGASPRAGMALIATARALAAMEGRAFVIPDDVKRLAPPVLRHRLLPTAEAELEGLDADEIVHRLLADIEVPR